MSDDTWRTVAQITLRVVVTESERTDTGNIGVDSLNDTRRFTATQELVFGRHIKFNATPHANQKIGPHATPKVASDDLVRFAEWVTDQSVSTVVHKEDTGTSINLCRLERTDHPGIAEICHARPAVRFRNVSSKLDDFGTSWSGGCKCHRTIPEMFATPSG
jgi:hypothetical protein